MSFKSLHRTVAEEKGSDFFQQELGSDNITHRYGEIYDNKTFVFIGSTTSIILSFLSLGIEEFVYKPLSFNQICAMTLGTLTYHPFNYMLLKLTAPSRLYVCFCYWLVSHRDSCVFFNICKQSSKHSKGLKLCIIYLSGGRKTLHPLCMKS